MYRIWIIEDDAKIAALVAAHLSKYGYEAQRIEAYDEVKRRIAGSDRPPHLVVLDINLPKYDGFYICRQIRSVSNVPILFLSARAGEMDQVMAIEHGGDDYVTKPFHLEVLLAKIRGLLRRTYGEYAAAASGAPPREDVAEFQGLFLDRSKLTVEYEGRKAELTPKELQLLGALMTRPGEPVAREALLERLWDDVHFVDDNTLTVNVTRVRKKLEALGTPHAIETVRGVGYRLAARRETP
ncbi:response regulator transcription factor [Paenibacillus antri]|uniref:Response regulator transcription factor n=1 Tax=Paenibacillus antri TaxID=2582848 RepID=A0A5R9FYQ3_9BACL|nr:response regulator transcription factor [Paenibacillus antri]TLS49187.1 response regulator transcription factor [Paenibacillus antri]